MVKKDTIYSNKQADISDFSFDHNVVEVFDDMLSRSIPGYSAVLHQIGAMAKRYVKPHTNIYDLGCSLGAATFAVRNCVAADGCKIIAVDMSREMIYRFESRLKRHVGVVPVEIRNDDILQTPMENASFVVMNFTLQFIDSARKEMVIKKIFDSMVPGSVLVLSEKIVFENSADQETLEELYYDLKRHNGYNDLEISQKRDALENVLKLETLNAHHARLQRVGFAQIHTWYQNLNFASMLAYK